MEKMIGYIFGSLKNADDAINEINKSLRRQNRLNSRFAIYSLATIAWLYIVDKRSVGERNELEQRIEKQDKIIDKLNAEIRELKTVKGEHSM